MHLSLKFVRCQKYVSDYFDHLRPARCLTVENHLSAILTPPSNWRYLWNIFMNNHVTFHLHSRFLVNQSEFSGHELKVTQPLHNIENSYWWEFKFNYDNSEVLELSVSNCSREGGRVRMDGTIFTTKTLFKDWHWIIPISWASWNSRTFRLRHISPNSFLNMSDEYVR